jgi:2-polyprenyl-6-methoxyphenol hydroxylase-like FAD-dependent oxidoreductase
MAISLEAGTQVIVAGGGPAGIVAALAAARTGASTLLIERNGFVGGEAATGLPLLAFHDNRDQPIVKGIPWEIVTRLVDNKAASEVRNTEPPPGQHFFTSRIIAIDPEAFKYVALQMLQEAGVELLLHSQVSDVVLNGEALNGLVVENKSGRVVIPANRVIDCSGDGDIAARAGVPFEKGRPGDHAMQPLTLMFILGGIDLDKALEGNAVRLRRHALGPQPWKSHYRSFSFDLTPWAEELGREFPEFRGKLRRFSGWSLGDGIVHGGNFLHIPWVDGTDAKQLSQAEVKARMLVWRLCQFLRERAPGFENAQMISTMGHVGVRETRRIMGEYCLTYEDVLEAKQFEDVVTLCGYFVDIHDYSGGPDFLNPSKGDVIKEGGAYDIPYRCMVPKIADNLLISGRCISATHEAQASLRVMGTAMGLGHAAGTAAALSLQAKVSPRDLNVQQLQQMLLRQGAHLGDRFLPIEQPVPPTA